MEQDWRLNGQEEYLQNATLYKVVFPNFWEKAYAEKNAFYHKISEDAHSHVKLFPDTADYLEEEKIRLLWHEHCDFCWDKAMTDIPGEFYCTESMNIWICKTCYEDFKEQFGWTEKSVEELLALNTPSSEELHQIYHILKTENADYPLIYTTASVLNRWYREKFPIIRGRTSCGICDLYMEDHRFVFYRELFKDETANSSICLESAEEAINCIKNFLSP